MRYAIAAAVTLLTAGTAHAEDHERFFVRAGLALATFDAAGKVEAGGQPLPGADASVKDNTGVALEAGIFLTRRVSASFTMGVPPKASIYGKGSLQPAGLLGTARYAPSVLALQYNAPGMGRLHPYLGAGFNYTLVYNAHGGAIGDLKVSDGHGPVLQVGTEYRVGRNTAIFFDVKKIWVTVDASGTVNTGQGLAPSHARVALDPLILHTGLSWHF